MRKLLPARLALGSPTTFSALFAPLLSLLVSAAPASAVTMDWVAVGNPGNAADTATNCWAANCGSVGYGYYISKYEVTNAQYAEFLNAKAASDPLGLYNTSMDSSIYRIGVPGSYIYGLWSGMGGRPVNYVSFFDSLRFTNWLHNGQGSGDTESGAYTLLGGTATPSNGLTVTRNAGAIVFLPSENEWYKAAYYDGTLDLYYDYPAGTDTQMVCSAPTATANSANCGNVVGTVTAVGAYTGSASPYGTFDQGGNVWERNEQIVSGLYRGVRGSGFGNFGETYLGASVRGGEYGPENESSGTGFRVAMIPEPGTAGLLATGLLALAAGLRRRS